jgi:pimeloyl-ACP methyl ester carboxylesterase
MKPFRRILLVTGLLLVLALVVLYHVRGLEVAELDAAARAGATGDFLALTDGVTHYQIAGRDSGPGVVLIHGFSVPYYIWDGTFEALAASGFRVLRYDEYGRGLSDRPDRVYDSALYDRQLLELLDTLGFDAPVAVAGVSMGGAVAMAFAARHPERVSRLVLVDPMYERVEAPATPEVLTRLWMRLVTAHGLAEGQWNDFVHPERFPDWADRYREQMRYRGFQRALVSTLHHFFPEDHLADYRRVGELGKPVLLIWGREDRTIPFAASETVRQTLDTEFLAVDDAGHLPYLERPEVVNPRIVEFLGRDAAPPGAG